MFVTLNEMIKICGVSAVIGIFIGCIIMGVFLELFGGRR